jgi:tetratricopeptide (TPR) repeat protein
VRALADTVPESREAAALGLSARTRTLELGVIAGVLDAGEAEALFAEGKAIAARCGDHGALALLTVVYALQRLLSGEVAEAFEHYQEASGAAERTDNAALQLAVRTYLVDAHFFRGDVRGALAFVEECIERSGGDPELGRAFYGLSPYVYCTAWRALLFLQMGRLVEAERQGQRALDLCRQHGERETLVWVLGVLAQVAAAMGHGERALARAREMQEQAEKTGAAFLLVMSSWTRGQVHLDAGRWSEAVAALEQAVSTARQARTFLQSEGWLLAQLAQAYAGSGDLASARATAEEALEVAVRRRTRLDECLASFALTRVLVQAEGAPARAEIEAAVARGLALVEETGAALYTPRFHVERAELARLLGDEATYQRELREANRLFVEMGATGHAERISRQLSAVSSQPEER